MWIGVLGPVVVRVDGAEWDAGPPQQRALLAALALRRGVAVTADELVADVWGGAAPDSAVAIVQTYVSGLRKRLGKAAIVSSGHGYALVGAEVDAVAFEDAVATAQQARAAGDQETAAGGLRRALELWRGPALADLPGPGAERHRLALSGRRLAVQVERIELDLELGRHRELEPELRVLAAESPFDEHLRALLITALYRSGRQADAIAAYHDCRRLLADELGVDPGQALRDLYARIVRADPGLTPDVPPSAPVPRQLPAPLALFTGRDEVLERADALLDRPSPMIVFAGMGGVGKTTTALHWAHRVAANYPDGQLYAELRGYGDEPPATANDILDRFLRALGSPIPADLDARAARFRELTTGRRMLVLLDNAVTADHVRDLLPGPGDSLVVVTSRGTLPELAVRAGARVVALHPPGHDEALAMLAARVGADRVRREPAAARDIVELSGRLPLALSVVAARVAGQDHLPLSRFAAELSATHGTLEAFGTTEAAIDVGTVLSWSYGRLEARTAEAFRLLCAHPGPDLTVEAAASMLARPAAETRAVLRSLVGAALLTEHLPHRYAMHDLVRAFGRETSAGRGDDERRPALRRLLDHYVHTTTTAAKRIFRSIHLAEPEPAAPGALIPDPDPRAWFDAEHPALLAVFDVAEREGGFDGHLWRLAWALRDYLNRHGLWHHLQVSQNRGLAAAERSADPVAQGHSLWGVALAESNLGRHAAAEQHLRRALDIFTAIGDHQQTAVTDYRIAYVLSNAGEFEDALAHGLRMLDARPPGAGTAHRARVLNLVSDHCVQLGRFAEAAGYAREALDLAGDHGPFWRADTWETLAAAQSGLGDNEAAEASYRRSVALYRELGADFLAATTLRASGDAWRRAGRDDRARTAYREARELLPACEDPRAPNLDAELVRRLAATSPAKTLPEH
ncbi:BTAD domain-containing putative transcriptional regulator [Actinoplanes sp. NPDC049265]|uniref:AfsR/SARP family transcriptional regulator n=1 Tax=Actinoplanes sp. NPDC049265 TaxID=3363902 RepID=UPI00371BAA1C